MTEAKHTLADQLRDEAQRLGGHSIDRGCVDSGIASNLAERAADTIDDLVAALQTARKYVETCADPFNNDDQVLKRADAAIAKATGGA